MRKSVLFYLFLLTLWLSSMTLSSYVTQQTGQPQESQIARLAFNAQATQTLNMTDAPLKLDVSSGQVQSGEFSFVVQNYLAQQVSQVGLNYAVRMTFDTPIDSGVTIEVLANGVAGQLTKISARDWLFQSSAWSHDPGSAQDMSMTVRVTASKTAAASQNFNFAILSLRVIASQID